MLKGRIYVKSDKIENLEDETKNFDVEFNPNEFSNSFDADYSIVVDDVVRLQINFYFNVMNQKGEISMQTKSSYIFTYKLSKFKLYELDKILISAVNEVQENLISIFYTLYIIMIHKKLSIKCKKRKKMS